MSIILAPMEGVVDYQMRRFLSSMGGYDLCVTEFIRIVDQVLPARVFHRYCPELKRGSRTDSGIPVRIQLLGQDPQVLAENASKAIELGSHGIDLNFGCPSKMVNNHRGGAVLLKDTEHLHRIVSAVRKAVPEEHQVTAKIRLGFEDKALALDNAKAIEEAGANILTVHARTKTEGYRPPAHWDWLSRINEHVSIPVVANGEIWNLEHFKQCADESGCQNFMLGRGALACPDLAKQIAEFRSGGHYLPLTWADMIGKALESTRLVAETEKHKYVAMRTKQWLGYLKLNYPQAKTLFEKIKRINEPEAFLQELQLYVDTVKANDKKHQIQ